MSQEQHKALNESNLNEDVAEAYGNEIQQGKRRLPDAATAQSQRQNQKCQYCGQRDDQHKKQNQDAEVDLPIDPMSQACVAENLTSIEREEEERCIVVDRRNVICIPSRKRLRIVTRDQLGKRVRPRI